jgi:F-type H+-transporting ATPase subunit a
MSAIPEAVEINFVWPTFVIMNIITLVLITLFSFIATSRLKMVPRKLQNIFEMVLEFIFNLSKSIIGEDAKKFFPFFLGLFLYIFIGNMLGLVPGFQSPTANINTTLGLSLVVFIGTQIIALKAGPIRYVKHFAGDVPGWLKPLMFLIEVVSELAKPISLSFRLFGNIMSKEILLGILAFLILVFFPEKGIMNKLLGFVPLILRPLFILFGILVSFIQAFVFTMLTMIYVGASLKVSKQH